MFNVLKRFNDDENKYIYVFGAGKYASEITTALTVFGFRIDGYFDNKCKDGGIWNGFKILPLDVLINADKENVIIIVAGPGYEITKQLKEYGYMDNIIYKRDLATRRYEDYEVLEFPVVEEPEVSVCVTAYNQWNYTYNCLKSLIENGNKCKYEVIIGDDCSTDETRELEKYIKNVKVVHHKDSQKYLGNVNAVAKLAKAKYMFLMGNDEYFTQKGYIDKLLKTIKIDEQIGAVSGKYWCPACGEYQIPGNYINGVEFVPVSDDGKIRNVEFLWPVATLYRKHVWDAIDGYDREYLPAYREDNDLGMRIIAAGYSMVYNPNIECIHYGGATCSVVLPINQLCRNNMAKFEARWGDFINNFDEKRMAYINKVYSF